MTWTPRAVDADGVRFIATDDAVVAIADLDTAEITPLPGLNIHAPLGHGSWRDPTPEELARLLAAFPDSVTASGDFDESKHPRDEKGRWTSDGGGSEATSSTYVARHGDPAAKPDPEVTAYAIKQADEYAANSSERSFAYTGGNGIEKWMPGSAEALSETMSAWQSDYDQSYEMQVGADMLMGYGSTTSEGPGGWTDAQSITEARELLSAMADGPPPGAQSVYEGEDDAALVDFGENELARGVADENGTVLQTFREALDSGGTVQWSVAAFVDGKEGSSAPVGPASDNPRPKDDAATQALSYALMGGESFDPRFGPFEAKENPLVIRTDGQGLDLGAHYEVLVGGTFSVREIRPITDEERMNWGANDEKITVVQLHQEENVKLPKGVSVR